ncbi:MAG: undecaprenyldiphospho-muramoylpentapeptide beta-N-acetylglucosaminyltransferase, partial [Verrucomicrobiae bacterium]|nr:undecaprenyldiphospho-muramoylpentapeptide beta-N-acetylglucosaminyltransferase [Verrucomicrobiae bacterium]
MAERRQAEGAGSEIMANNSDVTPGGPGKLVIACGGTGGHLFPGIAVAEAWRARGGEVLLIISEKQIDTLATEGYDYFRFERQPAIAMPPILSPRIIGFAGALLKGISQSCALLKSFGADAVLGMGGFTSTAPMMAGKWLGLPTYIHESNAIPGRANLLNARFSTRVLVGFDACADKFDHRKVEVVGTPLRPSVWNRPSREEGLRRFGLRPDRKTLLVMGGSQGARRINELVGESLARFPSDRLQVLHISGPQDHEMAKAFHQDKPADLSTVLLPFCAEMQYALAAADLAICRSGASTLTELAHYSLPSILVPYPFAAHDHQTRNAEVFSNPGAAMLWPQDRLDAATFANELVTLMEDDAALAEMKVALGSLAVADAAERICDLVVSD